MAVQFTSAMGSGALGAFVGNPCDLILIRMQADSNLPEHLRRNYKSFTDGVVRIVKEDGVGMLWRGCNPTVVRAMFMTAGQVAFYDQFKYLLTRTKYFRSDSQVTHFTAASGAGFVTTIICSPVDVVKTRIMNFNGKDGIFYKGVWDCFVKTYKNEGVPAFFKGFVPNFARLVPHTILTFLFLEQLYKLTGNTSQYG